MKLQQLRYLRAVIRNNLNISAAADRLYTSQPGISRQIRLLEEELGVEIFERSGRQLSRLTPAGEAIATQIERTLVEVEAVGRVAEEFSDRRRGNLSVATTHSQARHVLPSLVRAFNRAYPRVEIQLHQVSAQQVPTLIEEGVTDFGISTEAFRPGDDIVVMPCNRWRYAVVVPAGHALQGKPLSLELLSGYSILTYVQGGTERTALDKAFRARALPLAPILTASDADIIKTYVRMGMGVGIIASLAYDRAADADLVLLEAGQLLPTGITRMGFRKGLFLRQFHYDFMRLFASHLTAQLVDAAAHASASAARTRLFQDIELELR